MHARSLLLAIAVAFFSGSVNAVFSDGTIDDHDYLITYSGYSTTLDFCTAFRNECIDYVGNLDYHHQLDCVTTQTGPSIYAWCGGVLKTSTGDTGTGPAYDFTTEICPLTKGCSIAKDPVSPTLQYGDSSTSTSIASSTSSSAASAVKTTSSAVNGDSTTVTSSTVTISAKATSTGLSISTSFVGTITGISTGLTIVANATTTSVPVVIATSIISEAVGSSSVQLLSVSQGAQSSSSSAASSTSTKSSGAATKLAGAGVVLLSAVCGAVGMMLV